jgi:hypothetical protein
LQHAGFVSANNQFLQGCGDHAGVEMKSPAIVLSCYFLVNFQPALVDTGATE